MDSSKAYKKAEFNKRFKSMMQELGKWKPAYQDLSTYINPTRGSFSSEPNRGKMIDHKVLLDGHATHDSRILASGMSSGMTNPARPWFRMTLEDKVIAKLPTVRAWLDEVRDLMLEVCAHSNIYDVFYSIYEELGIFGTGCAIILEDYDTVIRGLNFTAGEYALGADEKGRVNAFCREFKITVGQCVDKFKEENCSAAVQAAYKNNQVDSWVTIRHLIEPNTQRNAAMADFENMPIRSAYWEASDGTDKFLAVRGFMEFPIIAPRWDQITTDMINGYGPGWHALGNVKQLQKTTLDKLLAQEKLHNPPMQGDASLDDNAYVDLLPGGMTRTSSQTPNAGIRPAYQINVDIASFIEAIDTLKKSIDKDFFVDVFLMMINFDKTNMTATEVAQREQENIMMMGPLLNRVNSEMLDPYLERQYAVMERNGLLPEPPEEIAEMPIKIEYVSILAQAQKAIGVQSINRVREFVDGLVEIKPDITDVIDWDEATREVSEMEGIPAKLVVERDVVNRIREQREQARKMQEAAEMANSGADTAQKLASAKTEEPSALSNLMEAAKG